MNLKKLEFKVEIHHFNPGAKKHPPSELVFLKSATQTRHGFLRFGIVGSAISFLYRILSITFFFHLDISQLSLKTENQRFSDVFRGYQETSCMKWVKNSFTYLVLFCYSMQFFIVVAQKTFFPNITSFHEWKQWFLHFSQAISKVRNMPGVGYISVQHRRLQCY